MKIPDRYPTIKRPVQRAMPIDDDSTKKDSPSCKTIPNDPVVRYYHDMYIAWFYIFFKKETFIFWGAVF
jgi:hypothetical protein